MVSDISLLYNIKGMFVMFFIVFQSTLEFKLSSLLYFRVH